MRSVHANAWNVIVSPAEVALFFGMEGGYDAVAHELTVRLSDRILLNPHAAKRLAQGLRKALQEHEARYGAPATPAPRPISLDEVLPGAPTPQALEQADTLLQAVRDLGAAFGLEQSFKLSRDGLLENRFLVSMAKRALGGDPEPRVLRICRLLGMPEELLEAFAAKLPSANYIHAGFEEGARRTLYKLYLEFWTDWEREILGQPARRHPFLLHLGFKWDPADRARQAVSTYTCHPRLPLERIRERVAGLFAPGGEGGGREAVQELLTRASASVGAERLLYLEVAEAGNPRRSFDINFYKAGLYLRELGEPLRRASREYAIPAGRFERLYARAEEKQLGHVSGGIDRAGGDFLTIYYGMRGY